MACGELVWGLVKREFWGVAKRGFSEEVEEGGALKSVVVPPPCRLKRVFCEDEEEAAPNSVWLPLGGRVFCRDENGLDEEEAAPNSVWLPPGGRLEESWKETV